MRGLTDRVAIVTGATQDMGEAIARRLNEEGAVVIGAGRDAPRGEAVAARLGASGGVAHFVPVDVTDEDDIERLVAFAHERYGRVDVVVNNAAAVEQIRRGRERPVAELSRADFERQLQVNLVGPFLLARAVLPKMVEARRGAFVSVSTWNATRAVPSAPGYSASKAGLEALDRQVARDYGEFGIRANSIRVGMIRVGANHAIHDGELGQQLRDRVQVLPDMGRPDDVAAAVAYLASDDARFVTGTTVAVDGGAIMRAGLPEDLMAAYVAGLSSSQVSPVDDQLTLVAAVRRDEDGPDA